MTGEQGDLLQLAAQQARDEAIARVDAHADSAWRQRALQVVEYLAATRGTFTTDDVWEQLAVHGEATHEPRALGAIMRTAARQGICAPTPTYRTSSRAACHARPVRVWRAA